MFFFLLTAGATSMRVAQLSYVPLQENRRSNCQMTVTIQPPTEHTASWRNVIQPADRDLMSVRYSVLPISYYCADILQDDAKSVMYIKHASIWEMYAYLWLQNGKGGYHLEVPGVTGSHGKHKTHHLSLNHSQMNHICEQRCKWPNSLTSAQATTHVTLPRQRSHSSTDIAPHTNGLNPREKSVLASARNQTLTPWQSSL
jgi:hypothetical protein